MGDYIQEDWFYRVYKNSDDKIRAFSTPRRDYAYDYFVNNNCEKIVYVDKLDWTNETIIVDKRGFEMERIRNDFSIKKTKPALRRAVSKYDKNNTKQFCLKLNKNNDKEIIDYLDTLENKQGFIKDLILNEINRKKKF